MQILEKGIKVELKDAQGAALTIARVGLGWDVKSGKDVDVDSSMLVLTGGKHDNGGKVLNPESLLYYGRLTLPGLKHSGDNRTGAGDGDDETITITFADLPAEVTAILSIVNIFSGESNFGSISNVITNIYNGTSTTPDFKYDLSEDFSGKNAIIVGEFYKHNGEWKYAAIAEGLTGSLQDAIHRWE